MSNEKYMTVGELLKLKNKFIDECVGECEFDKWDKEYFGKLFCEKNYFSQNPIIRKLRRFFFYFHPVKAMYEKGHKKVWYEDVEIDDLNEYFSELSSKLWLNQDPIEKLNRIKNENQEKRSHIAECRKKIEELKKKAECEKFDKANKINYYCDEKAKEINEFEKKINEYETSGIYKDAMERDSRLMLPRLKHFDRFFLPRVWEEGEIISLCKFPQLELNKIGQVSGFWENDKDGFYKIAQEYVEKYRIYDDCVSLIKNEVYFSDVRDSIEKTLNYFDKDPFTFCMLAAANIEGIVSMYCLDLGHGEREVLGKAISDKVELLYKRRMMFSLDLDYYTYLYPVFRNRLMHGVQQNLDWKYRACAIVLDLHAILKKHDSKILRSNIIRKIKSDNKKSYSYQGMVELLAANECVGKSGDKEIELLMQKYHALFLSDVMDKIKRGEKVEHFCASFAKKLDKNSSERRMIFSSLKPKEDSWKFLEQRAEMDFS